MKTFTDVEKKKQESKVSVTVPKFILQKIDEASKAHADCGRGVIIRLALYDFFKIKN